MDLDTTLLPRTGREPEAAWAARVPFAAGGDHGDDRRQGEGVWSCLLTNLLTNWSDPDRSVQYSGGRSPRHGAPVRSGLILADTEAVAQSRFRAGVCRACSQMCSRDHPRRPGTNRPAALGKVQLPAS